MRLPSLYSLSLHAENHGSFVHEVGHVAPGDERLELMLDALRLAGREDGMPSVVPSLATFLGGSWRAFGGAAALEALPNWRGVLVAGGAVLAALLPLPQKQDGSGHTGRRVAAETAAELAQWYHGTSQDNYGRRRDVVFANGRRSSGFEGSDIDVFLYGLGPADALQRIRDIRRTVRSSPAACFALLHSVVSFSLLWLYFHL